MSKLEDLKRLEAAATKGPWQVDRSNTGRMLVVTGVVEEDEDDRVLECEYMEEDAAFISAIRNAAPKLLAVVEAAAEVIAARDTIEELAARKETTAQSSAPYIRWIRTENALRVALAALAEETPRE